jgi:uncharacterized protein YbjT (DUF2867 family)
MRVLVTGAYGLIGSAILARLYREGHELVGCGRSLGEVRRRFPYAHWVEADFLELTDAEAWLPLLVGIDAVVNCVGVLQDRAGGHLTRVQVDGTVALFNACAEAGVRRVIHVSAVGAGPSGATRFTRTKAVADAQLMRLDLDWTILRPALVLAPAAHGGSAMLRGLAGVPIHTPIAGAYCQIQIVSVDDIADTVALSLKPGAPAQVTWELAHPQVLTFAELVRALRAWHGFAPQPMIALSRVAQLAIAAFGDMTGWLGWRTPAGATAVAELAAGVRGDPSAWMAATGIAPRSLAAILAERPASVQDRWFARLYFLKPAAIVGLALFWIVTGVIALGSGREPGLDLLGSTGVKATLATLMLWGAALSDITLGVMLLVRRTARLALILMLVLTLIYAAAATVLAPQLWVDPLGPLTKLVPLVLATLFTLAIHDAR